MIPFGGRYCPEGLEACAYLNMSQAYVDNNHHVAGKDMCVGFL
jgi:hypothetical protein